MNNTNNNSCSIASIICGIVSFFILPFIFGIVSVILGIIGIARQEDKKTYAVIGIILGVISVLYSYFAAGGF